MSGLRFQTIPVSIDGGYNDGTDDFISEQPSNSELFNVRFDERQQLAKRFGITARNDSATGSYGPVHSLIDVDGILHTIGSNGTLKYDTQIDKFTSASFGAPRHCEIKTDPIIRTNNDVRRPDCSLSGTLMLQTWEDPVSNYAYYQFFQLEGTDSTPVALTEPKVWTGSRILSKNVKTIYSSGSFIAVGFDKNIDQYLISKYTITNANYTFEAAASIEGHSGASPDFRTDFQMCVNNTDTGFYLAYRNASGKLKLALGNNSSISSIDLGSYTTNAILAIHHDASNNKVLIGMQDGTLISNADDLSGSPSTFSIFSLPTSNAYINKDFKRGFITREKDNKIWFGRSSCQETDYGANNFAGNSNKTILMNVTQIALLNTSYTSLAQKVCPRMCIVSQGGYISDIGFPVFVGADQDALRTVDGSQETPAQLASPVGYVLQPVYTLSSSIYSVDLVHHARCFQDKIATTQNCGTSDEETINLLPFYWYNYHTAKLNASNSNNYMFFTAPVIIEQLYGLTNQGAVSTYGYRNGADIARIKIGSTKAVRDVQTSNIRLIGGGAGTSMMDSVASTNNTPDAPASVLMAGIISGSSGSVIFGYGMYDYQTTAPGVVYDKFRIVYKYFDRKGNLHRSSPSSAIDGDLFYQSGTSSAYYPRAISFPNPYPTGLNGNGSTTILNHLVDLYAKPLTGTVYRKIATLTPAPYPYDEAQLCIVPAKGTGFITATSGSSFPQFDSEVDPNFDTFPELYSDEELGPWPTPALIDLCSTQNRLWGISAESRLDVWYSKPIVQGIAPEFSSENVVTIPQEGGECIGLAALDDKVIVFKQNKIFALFGDPGDKNGQNSSLQVPRLISGDVGCINPQSIVEGPFGAAFLSARGFYVIDRNLQFTFIGEDVKNYPDSQNVHSANFSIRNGTLIPATSEVRWTINGSAIDASNNRVSLNNTIVWNYRLQKWSIWDTTQANDACLSNGNWSYIGDTGYIYDESINNWTYVTATESDFDPKLKITTSWIKLGNIANYKRVRRILLTLRYFSGAISVRTRTNYANNWDTLKYFTQSTLQSLVDSNTGLVQLDIRPTNQKCESIQIEIHEGTGETETAGRAFELTNIQMEVGLINNSNFMRIGQNARK